MSETKTVSKINQTLFIVAEFLLLLLKIMYYICEATYRLIVPEKEKSVVGEVVLVTGASRGIGRALAIGYASLGATVVCWSKNNENNEHTINEIKKIGKGPVYGYRCDVSDKNKVFELAEKVKREVGNVTILINNAGIAPLRTLLDYNTDEISQVIDVNLMAHYWTIKAFLPNMIDKNHGHIVAISSITALHGGLHGTLYCATKSAVRALMESVSEEVRMYSKGKSSVKFTTVFPGLVTTDMITNERFRSIIKLLKGHKARLRHTVINTENYFNILIKAHPYQSVRFPRFFGLYSPQQAASIIIKAQRQDLKEKYFPSHVLVLATFGRLIPEKAALCITNFMGMHTEADN